ncbi:MAG: CPBP family intramembrane metalloprotease [Cyclobacteriaceae bacterium]|nr:CPBP family intramembrane metalloprotease [Cyclobacteriaceae bacterium HetDA_MAG_MS6]
MNKTYPSILQSFGIFGLFVVASIMVVLPVGSLIGEKNSWTTLIAYTIPVGGVLLFALRERKVPPREFINSMQSTSILVYLLCMLVIPLGLLVLDPIINLIPMPDWIMQAFKDLLRADAPSFMTVVLIGPILEEALFRGVILEGFLHRYSVRKSIIWSSVLFGLFHLNPWQFIGATLIGFFLGWIYYRTGSLLLCMLLHVLNNFLSFMVFYLTKDTFFSFEDVFGAELGWAIAGGALLIIALLIFQLNKVAPKPQQV